MLRNSLIGGCALSAAMSMSLSILAGGCVAVKRDPGTSGGTAGTTGTPASGGHPGAAGTGGPAGTQGNPDASTSSDRPYVPPASGTPKPGEFGSGGPTPDANCGLRTFGLDKLPPDLLIVLDRSGSMVNKATGGSCDLPGAMCGSRWVEMTKAINQVVAATQTSIRWGLKFFTNIPACEITDGATVDIGANTAPAIATAIMNMTTGGQTPTRGAMVSAGAYLKALTDPNPKFVMLATDGEPNCMVGNPMLPFPDTDAAIGSIKAVADLGFPVYVIGVATSGDVLDMTLRQMAKAGGRPRTADPEYYPVSSSSDLVAALAQIGGQIASCTFALGSQPPDPMNVAVNADGARVPQDLTHMNGWDYGPGMMSIQLYGSWCDKAKANLVKDVQAIFGCPGIVIP
jgi:hypothetical protein